MSETTLPTQRHCLHSVRVPTYNGGKATSKRLYTAWECSTWGSRLSRNGDISPPTRRCSFRTQVWRSTSEPTVLRFGFCPSTSPKCGRRPVRHNLSPEGALTDYGSGSANTTKMPSCTGLRVMTKPGSRETWSGGLRTISTACTTTSSTVT